MTVGLVVCVDGFGFGNHLMMFGVLQMCGRNVLRHDIRDAGGYGLLPELLVKYKCGEAGSRMRILF